GLEFLDVTAQAHVALVSSDTQGNSGHQTDVYRITNNGTSVIDTHLLVVARGAGRMENASGVTKTGDPYQRLFLPTGTLQPGQSIVASLQFKRQPSERKVGYSLVLLSGQGKP